VTLFSAAVLLFLVLDPFGNIPFFIAALQNVPRERHRRIIVRELFIALFVLVVFLFAGEHILLAIRMVFPRPGASVGEELTGEPFIVPLAIPYIAGPSALASVLLIMNQEPERWPEWLSALVLAWLLTGLIILASSALAKSLGKRVLIAIERLMGMLLVALAIQMLMTGVRQFLES
jgi:multiple antibiotic resistance protein